MTATSGYYQLKAIINIGNFEQAEYLLSDYEDQYLFTDTAMCNELSHDVYRMEGAPSLTHLEGIEV